MNTKFICALAVAFVVVGASVVIKVPAGPETLIASIGPAGENDIPAQIIAGREGGPAIRRIMISTLLSQCPGPSPLAILTQFKDRKTHSFEIKCAKKDQMSELYVDGANVGGKLSNYTPRISLVNYVLVHWLKRASI